MVTVQNISSLLASYDTSQAQKANTSQRLITPAPTNNEVQQIRQISSEVNAAKAKVDKEREPSTPKKPDAGFGTQEDKEDFQLQNRYYKKREKKSSSGRVDLKA